jgi:uncharacterized protein (TIGR03437 family)
VLINGIAAPVTLAYPTQVNAIVPFEIEPGSTANVQVEYNGIASTVVAAASAAANPALFTADSSGHGQCAPRLELLLQQLSEARRARFGDHYLHDRRRPNRPAGNGWIH